jgi:hypothetical protein
VVFVEDPAWFVMFARFAAFGARIVGVPRGADGPRHRRAREPAGAREAETLHPQLGGAQPDRLVHERAKRRAPC